MARTLKKLDRGHEAVVTKGSVAVGPEDHVFGSNGGHPGYAPHVFRQQIVNRVSAIQVVCEQVERIGPIVLEMNRSIAAATALERDHGPLLYRTAPGRLARSPRR